MKIAIIGAGGAGLVSARYCVDGGHECIVYEQTGLVGGTWNYSDCVGTDENGLPVHTSMYKGLMTNLPKEVMSFADFPFPECGESFLSQESVLEYINQYVEHFNLKRVIQFFKQAIRVHPFENKWSVAVRDVKTKSVSEDKFDAVMVCNGHYNDPFIPEIPGQNKFRGLRMHSHDYRTPEKFTGKNVLLMGLGPSGMDISAMISKVAKNVYLSHYKEINLPRFPELVKKKGRIVEVKEESVIFESGEVVDVDVIIYCTGYNYKFPFLTKECGIEVIENHVFPLYKHIINIEHNTMAFIGLIFLICPFPVFDMQARFFLSFLEKRASLPAKADMMEDLIKDMEKRKEKGLPRKKFHQIGERHKEYVDELASLAKIKPMPHAMIKLYFTIHNKRYRDSASRYKIIDEETFVEFK